jgi:hypothetical protein
MPTQRNPPIIPNQLTHQTDNNKSIMRLRGGSILSRYPIPERQPKETLRDVVVEKRDSAN